jgi:hypothetical protein
VRVELRDLGLNASQDVLDMLRVREPLQDRIENDFLNQAAPNEQLQKFLARVRRILFHQRQELPRAK